jgi:hypothetical protein
MASYSGDYRVASWANKIITDLTCGAFDHACHAPQVRSCNYLYTWRLLMPYSRKFSLVLLFVWLTKALLGINFLFFIFSMLAVGDWAHAQLVAVVTLARPCPVAFLVPRETWNLFDRSNDERLPEYLDCCRWWRIQSLGKNRYRDIVIAPAAALATIRHRSKVTCTTKQIRMFKL